MKRYRKSNVYHLKDLGAFLCFVVVLLNFNVLSNLMIPMICYLSLYLPSNLQKDRESALRRFLCAKSYDTWTGDGNSSLKAVVSAMRGHFFLSVFLPHPTGK